MTKTMLEWEFYLLT